MIELNPVVKEDIKSILAESRIGRNYVEKVCLYQVLMD